MRISVENEWYLYQTHLGEALLLQVRNDALAKEVGSPDNV
jgi:hypothetical protein